MLMVLGMMLSADDAVILRHKHADDAADAA
jgi:hypothetical protein